jgi:uncharacterized protein (DUF58 family)
MTPRLVSASKLLRRLEWRLEHEVENRLIGEYFSVFRGRGMEFDQVVKYEYGDDIRDIDWNVTARLGEAYRKKFVEERELVVMLVIEDSLSLQFGSGARTKREALFELAALIMLLAALNRDAIGVLHVQPGGYKLNERVRGRSAVFRAATELLDRPAPALTDTRPLETPWELLNAAAPNRSVMVILGDFPPRAVPREWNQIVQRYCPVGFRVDDPWERELPGDRPLTVYDPTTHRAVVVDPRSKVHQRAHAEWRAQRDAVFAHLIPRTKDRLVVTPDETMVDALAHFFHAHMGTAAQLQG